MSTYSFSKQLFPSNNNKKQLRVRLRIGKK